MDLPSRDDVISRKDASTVMCDEYPHWHEQCSSVCPRTIACLCGGTNTPCVVVGSVMDVGYVWLIVAL